MSVLVTDVINGALNKLNNRSGTRYTRPNMLQFYNEVNLEMAVTCKNLERDYYFDLEGTEGAYAYPTDRVQIKKIRVSRVDAPTSLSDYYPLNEILEDEFTRTTAMSRYPGYIEHYFARPEWFELVPLPVNDIARGGLITTSRIPAWLSSETGAVLELPDFTRLLLQEGVEIVAQYAGRNRAAAADEYQRWQAKVIVLGDVLRNPSDDRRQAIRPQGATNWAGDMV